MSRPSTRISCWTSPAPVTASATSNDNNLNCGCQKRNARYRKCNFLKLHAPTQTPTTSETVTVSSSNNYDAPPAVKYKSSSFSVLSLPVMMSLFMLAQHYSLPRQTSSPTFSSDLTYASSSFKDSSSLRPLFCLPPMMAVYAFVPIPHHYTKRKQILQKRQQNHHHQQQATRRRNTHDGLFRRLEQHALFDQITPNGEGINGNASSSPNNNNNSNNSNLINGSSTPSNTTTTATATTASFFGVQLEIDDTTQNANNNINKNNNNNESPTAPEVNQWTTIMTDGTTAAMHSPTKEMETLYDDLNYMSEYDKFEVEKYWDRLMPKVSYHGTENAVKIKNALRVAYCAHRSQVRKSGEPFIIHPVEVGLLLADLQMDAETIMAGLLHDTVEDTELTFEQVQAMFGPVVRNIVEGETKVSKLPKLAFSDYADEQAENLRQMFVAMTDDYRIIIVKLADRLHNMRTLRFMKPEKQLKISRETLDIFAPLAHRMGIWQFKSELEDTSFMYLYPMEYKRLHRMLRRHQRQSRDTLDKSQEILKKTLDADVTLKEKAFSVEVQGRPKDLYSLWYKMNMRGETNLDHITDVVALRVIIDPKKPQWDETVNETDRGVWLCYHVLGLVQHLPGFQPVPTKVKDYISFPKPNGYQSLHTALMINGQTVEVQIRTSTMHQIAEYGMASHWAYVDVKKRGDELYNTPWLSSIKEWQDEVLCSRDFVDCVRRELLGKRVFVFLRNGKILNLAKGATAVDAAFQIHTEVGLKMHGVEINGKRVPFSYELKNGDVVSVLTGDGAPATEWMRYATIRSTRSKLRSYFRKKQRESLRAAGEILLIDLLSMHGELIRKSSYLDRDFSVPTTVEEINAFLPGKSNYHDVDDLLIEIGKRQDRDFLRTVVAKIFLVPQSKLVSADENHRAYLSKQVLNAVKAKRQNANDAGIALNIAEDAFDLESDLTDEEEDGIMLSSSLEKNVSDDSGTTFKKTFQTESKGEFEIADSEYLCESCLPILGDEIVGTRTKGEDVCTVHRCGCPLAQKVANASMTSETTPSINTIRDRFLKLRLTGKSQEQHTGTENEIVKMQWDDSYMSSGEDFLYLAEVSVIAKDRKLLLADCSETVSDMSEIVKTGSLTTDEHATLEFLVKVKSLDHLQKLMDSLMEIQSVMSVERKFGSSL